MQLSQRIFRVFPTDFISLNEGLADHINNWVILAEGFTSRSHEKSSMEGVRPSASGFSLAEAGGATYLYSFFKTVSVK